MRSGLAHRTWLPSLVSFIVTPRLPAKRVLRQDGGRQKAFFLSTTIFPTTASVSVATEAEFEFENHFPVTITSPTKLEPQVTCQTEDITGHLCAGVAQWCVHKLSKSAGGVACEFMFSGGLFP